MFLIKRLMFKDTLLHGDLTTPDETMTATAEADGPMDKLMFRRGFGIRAPVNKLTAAVTIAKICGPKYPQ